MSHNTGTVQIVSPAILIGPDSGQPATMGDTWSHNFVPAPAPGGTKFVLLRFGAAAIPAGNRVEVDLGYGTDIFDSTSGTQFWTRPINHDTFPGGISVRYVAAGSLNGSVELQQYGRGESLPGDPGHPSVSNSDPFLLGGSYTEPTYDPFWFCNTPPSWANVQCVSAADVRRQVARSCGMIVTVHGNAVSTCSVTLIGPDTVITAGHCLASIDIEWPTSSVTFAYETLCNGGRPDGYNPIFHKVTGYLKFRWNDGSGMDYAILQIAIPPGGLGIPVIPLRNSLPAVGEQIFGVHHPNGAVKKLAPPHTVSEFVNSASASFIGVDIDVSGGSSGSGLFDMMGRYVGVLSHGWACNLRYFPSASVLGDIAATPTPMPSQDVMLVVDRSGSMSGSAGTGQSKMAEARDAASLFVQLIRSNAGHRAGLASFSTNASLDSSMGNVNPGKKNQLIGPAPFSGGAVGALTPGGWTSIGAGIDMAQTQFTGPGSNPKTILLLTDGLQNTPPMIADAVSDIGAITVHAIGLGTESNLNGAILSDLAQSTGGAYTRAGDGLDLKKFFALAFGDIFEAGTLTDPTAVLPRDRNETAPVEFDVCDEDRITVVVGWDRIDAHLEVVLTTPGGATVTATTAGVEASTGRTWSFLRLDLPHDGSREGTWKVVFRRPGGGEFPPPPVPLRYFMNVIASGGPIMRPLPMPSRCYTGDSITPLVRLAYHDGQDVHGASVRLSVTRPDRGAGNILADAGLDAPVEIDGDAVPPQQATLMALEQQQGSPLFTYAEEWYDLNRDRELTGAFEEVGPWGRRFDDLLVVPGNYSFRAVGRYGHDCIGMRETSWSAYVAVGVDPDATTVTVTPVGQGPGGRDRVRVTITPRDRFGNLLGPGSGPDFTVSGLPGSTVIEPVTDNGDGSYSIDVLHDPGSGHAPGVSVTQPGRPSSCIEVGRDTPATRADHPWWLWLIILALVLIIIILLLS